MFNQKGLLGRSGEDLAVKTLVQKGYRIMERNFKTRYGEIDIIARCKDVICFVEVKTRCSDTHGHPLESISWFKRSRLRRSALAYLQQKNLLEAKARFDAVAISRRKGKEDLVEVIPNAFEMDE